MLTRKRFQSLLDAARGTQIPEVHARNIHQLTMAMAEALLSRWPEDPPEEEVPSDEERAAQEQAERGAQTQTATGADDGEYDDPEPVRPPPRNRR